MIGSGHYYQNAPLLIASVSILVVLDDWFGAVALYELDPFTVVSILVVLDDWFGDLQPAQTSTPCQVSILVVLDDWFGVV